MWKSPADERGKTMRQIQTILSRWRDRRAVPAKSATDRTADSGHHFVELDGHSFHYRAWGQADSPILLMLHGFPEYSDAWSEVAEALAGSYRCIAPDQRGYGQSWAPPEVESYGLRLLVHDMAALIGQLGGPVTVVGHDWGAAVAYGLAMFRPELVSRLVVINGVHPVPFQREVAAGGAQSAASQYIRLLRAEGSEERLVANDFKAMLGVFSGKMGMEWLSPEKHEGYRRAWSDAARVRSMVNWYRASPLSVARPGSPLSEVPRLPVELLHVRCPHLVIWGDGDTALLQVCLEGLDEFAADLTVRHVADADHWICHQQPAQVAELIGSWLAERA
ncbi:pimeloyl-ACP methyl ester carboxylesterase [Hoeflea marina]|uniref:Pimeloyl-ACP methyl ester carboxylesterase n=1 Tax=Hoeflea marina TaxID=274592 RepID=A0A317PFF1_9HYPH|nr:alpha/beta hydrolase [Hoeflea marina]PWV98931.1 pimeloyl-ACP methyl ester carboxylesterase [Hoeflea marina]